MHAEDAFIPEACATELGRARTAAAAVDAAAPPVRWSEGALHELNPTLQALSLSWRNLGPRAAPAASAAGAPEPVLGEETLLIWRSPWNGRVVARAAGAEDLLALKIVVEAVDVPAAAAAGPLSVGAIENVLARAADCGIILAPRPLIRRGEDFPRGAQVDGSFFTAAGFTLQWHLTQACDLHCRHCYDRSDRAAVPLSAALGVLDDLQAFCRERRVSGSVSLSGGNPLLHPDFTEIYRGAADRGFGLCILGNPAPRARIEELVEIRRPAFFQVSLEGLPDHNDWVRGSGHFARTVGFLRDLKELGVSSMVMLTLTESNIDQVIPLAKRLRGLVDDFHFNRLAMVGEGANLRLPSRERYARFLEEYLEAAEHDPALGIKDNLINILRRERGAPLFGGCTGFGCGAAFNFIALLPDGEAHACRKFPSPIGNAVRDGLAAVYDSARAAAYRRGCSACRDCAIRPVCGGCLAVAHGFGLDPLRERDPLCFLPGS
jgi:selenobiotic family peptide radical SAM maturase